MDKLRESAKYIEERLGTLKPEVLIVLGSGLGDLGEEIENPVIIDYQEIPHFPHSTVSGHKGRFVCGFLEGKTVIAMQGRFHYYEGWSMEECVYPIRVLFLLGVKALLLTNAAGCVNREWKPGDLMLITDHIKLCAENPCRGINNNELGPRFFDMTNTYDKLLQQKARDAAKKCNIDLKEGVYMYFAGPNFETPAEVRLASICGADCCGMSTVPEAIAASQMGIKTMGLSCMTNMAAGILDQKLNHEEVIETGNRVKDKFSRLVKEIIASW